MAWNTPQIWNILRKSSRPEVFTINEDRLLIDEEKHLFNEINKISSGLEKYFEKSDYNGSLSLLAGLSPTIEAFFDKVMVMDVDLEIRNNRLNLLLKLKTLFDRVANLALIGWRCK